MHTLLIFLNECKKNIHVTAFSEEASDMRRFALVWTCIYETTHYFAEYMMKLKIIMYNDQSYQYMSQLWCILETADVPKDQF